MKRLHILFSCILAILAAGLGSCTTDPDTGGGGYSPEGALLNLTASFGDMGTRLAELGSPSDMNDSSIGGVDYGLNNVGLYIYYTADYNADDLTKPYVRNLECNIENGNILVPVLEPGQNPEDKHIYIYDKMTIVAFYPYNPEMSDPENYFEVRDDEDNYYITKQDYSEQYYIPYRAITTTNPTVSYYTQLTFAPRATYKIEIVVVSDDTSDFADVADIVILPNIDPIDTDTSTSDDGKRVKWYDGYRVLTDRGGGSNVAQYWAYVWTREDNLNDIPRGEILLQAGRLTLIASQNVPVQQGHVYRYGYNMSTGEIFIPTSTSLVWDAESLAAFKGGPGTYTTATYQVCDIDLTGVDWQPNPIVSGRYDGGGHKIENLVINSIDTRNVGLFSRVTQNSVVCNVNLIEPRITVNSADTVSVGAICGQLSDILTEEDIEALIGDRLPPDLSEVVKAAILADLLADAYKGTSRIVACRVEDPAITVNSIVPRVGTVCGVAGARNEEGEYKSVIKDTYSLGGTLTVNAGSEENNAGGYVGGFCGLNNGTILRSYATIAGGDIVFELITDPVTGDLTPAWEGFTNSGTIYTPAEGMVLTDDYAVADDSHTEVGQMPDQWPSWSSETPWWPVLTTGWISGSNSYWYDAGAPPATYPILQWERR